MEPQQNGSVYHDVETVIQIDCAVKIYCSLCYWHNPLLNCLKLHRMLFLGPKIVKSNRDWKTWTTTFYQMWPLRPADTKMLRFKFLREALNYTCSIFNHSKWDSSDGKRKVLTFPGPYLTPIIIVSHSTSKVPCGHFHTFVRKPKYFSDFNSSKRFLYCFTSCCT